MRAKKSGPRRASKGSLGVGSTSERMRTLSAAASEATQNVNQPPHAPEDDSLPGLTREGVRGIVREVVAEFLRQPDVLAQLVETLVVKATDKLQKAVEKSAEEVEKLQQQLNASERENQKLREDMETRDDEIEQYQRRNSLRIFGIPEKQGENTDEIVLSVAARLKVDIREEDIDRSHRVGHGQASNRPRPIIVKFVSYRRRSLLYGAKRHLKGSGITVREDLTASRLKVLRAAITRYGEANVWTQDGTVVILEGEERHRVTRFAQLLALEH